MLIVIVLSFMIALVISNNEKATDFRQHTNGWKTVINHDTLTSIRDSRAHEFALLYAVYDYAPNTSREVGPFGSIWVHWLYAPVTRCVQQTWWNELFYDG